MDIDKISFCRLKRNRKKNLRQSKNPPPGAGVTRQSPEAFLDTHATYVLLILLLLALALRTAALFSITHSIYNTYLLWDERLYHSLALKMLNGTVESTSFFSWFLAFLYFFFTPDPLVTRIVNVILGTAICLIVYLTGKELAGRPVGLAACLVAACYKPLILFSVVPLKTTLCVLSFMVGIYIIIKAKKETNRMYPLLLGLITGILANIRPNCLALVPFIPLLFLWSYRSFKRPIKSTVFILFLFILGFSFYLAPPAAKTIFGGSFFTSSGQAGINLYLGNNLDNPDPYYRPVPFAQSSPSVQERQFTIEASRRLGQRVTSTESSAYWISQIYKTAVAFPPLFLKKLARKTLVLFNRFEAGDHYDIDFIAPFVPFFKIPLFSFSVIFPLGFAGIIVASRRSKSAIVCLLICILYGATLVIFFTNMRYRLPLAAILIPFAVMGIHRCFSHLFNKRYGPAAIFIVFAVTAMAVEWLPLRGTDDMTAYYNTHAIVLNSLTREDEAVEYWKMSSRMEKPYSAFADLSLAGYYAKEKDTARARLYLDKIDDGSFASASKYELLGDIFLVEKNVRGAVDAYERSLLVNSGQLNPRVKLVNIFRTINPRRALEEKEKLEYILSFY